jgi:hypothetical protein
MQVKNCFPNLQALDLSSYVPHGRRSAFDVVTWGSGAPRLNLFVTNGRIFIESPQPHTTLLQDAAYAISALADPSPPDHGHLARYFQIRRYVSQHIHTFSFGSKCSIRALPTTVISTLRASIICSSHRSGSCIRDKLRVVRFFERLNAFKFKSIPGNVVPVPVSWNPSVLTFLVVCLSSFADTILWSLASFVVSAAHHAVVDPFQLPHALYPAVSHALLSAHDPPPDFCRAFAAAAPQALAKAFKSLGPRAASSTHGPLLEVITTSALPYL